MSIPKSVWHWAFYDFANSGYLVVYSSFLLPVFFSLTFKDQGSLLGTWGIANAIATVIGASLAIIIGKYSDKHSRFQSFKWSIIISFLGMLAISMAVKYSGDLILYFYIFTQSVFILSLSLSDSILPHVSNKTDSFEYSGFSWGFGYIGGIVALIAAISLQKILGDEYHPIVFLSTAIFYIGFSIYVLLGLKEVKMNSEPPTIKTSLVTRSQKALLLTGYWLISEAITIIILFFAIYLSTEFGYSTTKIGILVLIAQAIGFPATWYGGYLARKINILLLLGLTIIFWGITIFGLVLDIGITGIVLFVIFGAMAIGNSQSLLRAQYSNIIERSESGFQFGIYSVVSEAAVFIGPIIYGIASDYFHSQKIPMIFLFVSMAIGYILIWKSTKHLKNINN